MLTVEDYRKIRVAHSEGMSIRAIARKLHYSRRKIRQALGEPEPRGYTRQKEPYTPKLGPFKSVIQQILAEDQEVPRKQRHTASKLYRRLRDEWDYTGGYDQVRRYVQGQRQRSRETFTVIASLGDEPRRVLEELGKIRVVDVVLPTRSGHPEHDSLVGGLEGFLDQFTIQVIADPIAFDQRKLKVLVNDN